MLDKLIIASMDYLIRHQVIVEDDRDIYEYGFHALYNNIIDIASILIISIWLHQIPQTILYHIPFVALRNTAGGFHAKTHFRCFILSTTIWLFSLWGILRIISPIMYIGLAGLSVFLVWVKAPIENENSPLSAEKYKRMKILCRIISAVFFAGVLFISTLLSSKYNWIAASLAYGMASHSILILATMLQSYILKK